ncbi:MAG: hypothetical protein EOO32_01470 [Comamonadaceae bacterium]|nr:MAG: hypothetical protein EOO32_01470 [Comamonadaceae bacterium]
MVETVHYQLDQRRLLIQGWSVDTTTSQSPTSFRVRIDGDEATVSSQRLTRRDDVSASIPGVMPERAGFVLEVPVRTDLGWGRHEVGVTAQWGDRPLELAPASSGANSFWGSAVPGRHWWMAGIVGAFLICYLLCRLSPWTAVAGARLDGYVGRNIAPIAWTIVAAFAVLVGVGATGLSTQLLLGNAHPGQEHAFFTADSGMAPLALEPRIIRSDEWLVITPSALAQVHHQPPFPVVNHRLGTDGQNMMVIGMTGVPVWHVSTLAKPATWGFFVLPLTNALAWYWFFPVFACLLALWALLNQLAPRHVGRNLALSLIFCTAPYAAGWSQWPLYTTFFAAAALWALIKMVQTPSARVIGLLCVPLALFMAGFALVLYPPWQIPLATACGLLLLGWWLDRQPTPRRVFWPVFLLALALTLALLAIWWMDARDAVATMQNTVYPGGRKALHGGEFPLYWWTRGYSNTDTLPYLGASEVNASEFGAYFLLPIPLALLGWRLATERTGGHRFMATAWCLFSAWTLVFILSGVPPLLAKAMFWHVVPSHRVDLALAFASTLLLCLIPKQSTDRQVRRTGLATALTAAILSAALVAAGLLALPAVLYPSLSPVLMATMAVAGFCMAFWLVQGHLAPALGLMLTIYLCSSMGFNPMARGPDHLELHPAIRPFLQSAMPAQAGPLKRTLTVGMEDGMRASMSLAAAGVPVVNGVFYYPQFSLWKSLQLPPEDIPTINRYQHLLFDIGEVRPPRTYQVSTRSELSDVVIVTIDAARFDFKATGAEAILTKEANIQVLSNNPQLMLQGAHAGWAWFAVSNP